MRTWTTLLAALSWGFLAGITQREADRVWMRRGIRSHNSRLAPFYLHEAVMAGKQFKDEFQASQLLVSLMIGFVAGVLALIGGVWLESELVSKEAMMAVIASGYAGADFIEGFMEKAGK